MKDMYQAIRDSIGVSTEDIAKKFADQRMIPIDDRITKEMADWIIKILITLETKEVAPITLLISSLGGDMLATERVMQTIQNIHSPVDGLVIDTAESAAVDILVACRKRLALPCASFFIHSPKINGRMLCNADNIETEIAIFKQDALDTQKRGEDILMKALNLSRKEIVELLRLGDKHDRHYSAEEALKLGLIQEIVTDFKFFGQAKTV